MLLFAGDTLDGTDNVKTVIISNAYWYPAKSGILDLFQRGWVNLKFYYSTLMKCIPLSNCDYAGLGGGGGGGGKV